MAAAAGLSPCPARIKDVPTPPPLEVIEPHDDSPDEIESRAELDLHLAAGTLAGLAVQGLRLDTDPPDLSGVEVAGALFVGCRFTSREVEADLVRRGAHVVPAFVDLPAIQRHFAARTRAVLLAPYERLIDSGEPIRYGLLSSATREAWLRVAAAVAEGL